MPPNKQQRHLLTFAFVFRPKQVIGGNPGLVVMGGDSRSEGRGFESWRQILDGHFFTYICYKNLYCLFEKTKNKRKEAGVGPFF